MRTVRIALWSVMLVGCSSTPAPAPPDMAPMCRADSDCASSPLGHACNTATGSCVACTPMSGCSGGKKCNNFTACVDCLGPGDCPAGQKCLANSCVAGCDDKSPCPTGLVCDLTQGVCVACVASKDCSGATPACAPESHTCVACNVTADCPKPSNGSVACISHQCSVECAQVGCPSGLVCHVSTGACVQCEGDADCKSSSTPRCDPSSNTCVACLPASDNCPTGQYCANMQCTAGCKADADCAATAGTTQCNVVMHACVQCTSDAACPIGQVCNLSTNTCNAGCGNGHACPGGQGCCGGMCLNLLSDAKNCGGCGNACAAGSACCGGVCTSTQTAVNCGSCGTVCAVGADCCGGACTVLDTANNCGACGKSCSTGQTCCGGTFCANLQTDKFHCGACNNTCSTGQACCGGACVDPRSFLTDAKNCGSCGNACSAGQSCWEGQCVACPNGTCTPTDYEAFLPFTSDVNDVSGHAHNAFLVGSGVSCCSSGPGGLATDGSNSYAQINDAPGLDPPVFTVGFWMYWKGDGNQYPSAKYGGECQCYPLQWDIHVGAACVSRNGSENPCFGPGSGPVPANQWVYITLRYDGTNQYYYLNGSRLAVSSLPGAMYSGGTSPSPILIGSAHSSGQTFNGYIKDWVEYNRPLSEAEVFALSQTPK